MSPTATERPAERASKKSGPSKSLSLDHSTQAKAPASPAPARSSSLTQGSPATSSTTTLETKPTPATIPPSASPSAPRTHSEVLTLQSAYGNAAIARAASIGALPSGPAAPGVMPQTKAPSDDAHAAPAAPQSSAAPATGQTASPHSPIAAPPTPSAQSASTQPASASADHAQSAKPAVAAPPPAHPGGAAGASHPAVSVISLAKGAAGGAAKPVSTAKHESKAAHPGHGQHAAHDDAHKKSAAAAKSAIAPVVSAIHHRAAGARKHSAPGVPVASAQAAAINPPTEQSRSAAAQTVSNLGAAKTNPVKRDDFKSILKAKIESVTPKPKTESEADKVVKSGAANASAAMSGDVATQSQSAAGQLKDPTATDVAPSSQSAPPKTDLKPETLGGAPAAVDTAAAVPPSTPPEKIDCSSDRTPTDSAMTDAGVTKEQLEQGNEPEFKQNLASRTSAEQHEVAAQQGFRKTEAGLRDHGEKTAHAEVSQGLTGLHGARATKIAMVITQQNATKAKHAAELENVTKFITGVKTETRAKVDSILASMEKEAGELFKAGLERAEKAYNDTFEKAKGGTWTWLTTWGDSWRDLIESSLAEARQQYLVEVDRAVDQVSDMVDAKLAEAKQAVADGLKKIEDHVKGLDSSVRKFGEDALKSVTTDFERMTTEIDQRRDALVDKLADQYKASYERMSAMEEKLREENKSLWDRIYDATVGLIKKILAFKDMLLNVLSRAADAIGMIIAHPIAFLGNLVDAGKLGFSNFVDHIGEHLKQGFMEWLFGAVAETGIQLPKNFDLPGILSLVMQVLGLTYSNIRSRAVKILGEKVVKALETAAEIFKILITKGPAGLWEYIKEKVGDLKAMVIEKIKSFIMERVIMAGITWVIGLLNPASAFFKACKAIYDIVMFFIEHGKQILDLVNAVIDSITQIAKGAIGAAAGFVESSLARTIPVIIGFLASLLGVGGLSEKIKEIIEAIRKPINEAIDWVINKAVDLVKAVGSLLGFGKKDEKKGTENDPEHALKIEAGLHAIVEEENKLAKDGKISRQHAEQIAAKVKKDHSVFKSIDVVPGKMTWNYKYLGSEGEVDGLTREEGDSALNEDMLAEDIVRGLNLRGGETQLTEVSIRNSRTIIRNIFASEGVSPASMTDVDDLLETARNATNGDAISIIMARLSGFLNEQLKTNGSAVRVQAHHISRVAKEITTFINTKRGRLYIRAQYRKGIAKWLNDNAKLPADQLEEKRREIVSLLRDQLIDDKLTTIEFPLEEADMLVVESGQHRTFHAAERREGRA